MIASGVREAARRRRVGSERRMHVCVALLGRGLRGGASANARGMLAVCGAAGAHGHSRSRALSSSVGATISGRSPDELHSRGSPPCSRSSCTHLRRRRGVHRVKGGVAAPEKTRGASDRVDVRACGSGSVGVARQTVAARVCVRACMRAAAAAAAWARSWAWAWAWARARARGAAHSLFSMKAARHSGVRPSSFCRLTSAPRSSR